MASTTNRVAIYLKGEASTEVHHRDICLKDIAKIECENIEIKNHINTLKVVKITGTKPQRVAISVLKIIECIHQAHPNLQILNLGPTDLLITYKPEKKECRIWEYGKVIFVGLLVFVGSAFSMMAFNQDISITIIFGQIYEAITGRQATGTNGLEIGYSVGISLGILVFFNHFGKKRLSEDPTPMEVEMRLYEKDIETALIDMYSRQGEEMDTNG